MIFVTVGTHEQPFNRLIEYIDTMIGEKIVCDEVIMQIGFSTYEPKYCKFSKMYSHYEMGEKMEKARIVITHGGPSSFMLSLQNGKIPIVVPRQKQFGEHINDHQLEFSKKVAEKYNNIIVIDRIEEVHDVILRYESIVEKMSIGEKGNNAAFNENFDKLVLELFRGNM